MIVVFILGIVVGVASTLAVGCYLVLTEGARRHD